MDAATFRALGHRLVDQVADVPRRVAARPGDARRIAVGRARGARPDRPAPRSRHGSRRRCWNGPRELLFEHSLFNGHPRFFGYITAPPAPIGILGDFLAAAVNPNVGAWTLSPAATEIESQTVRWIAELIGYPADCGGLLVSGGNMANFVCFLARARAREGRLGRARAGRCAATRDARLRVYGSSETHTWIQKAADLCRPRHRRRSAGFRRTRTCAWTSPRCAGRSTRIVAAGDVPFLVVGTAGSVSTGAVDPLREIGALCREHGVWFHVDGAYGGFAAALPDAPDDLRALEPRRFRRGRSAQVALRAARGRMRARARSGRAARRVRVPSALLPLRGAGDELRRLRAAELARLPRAQGVAGAAAGRRRGLPHDDCRRHPPVAGDGRGGRPASGAAARDAGAEHHDVPLRAARICDARSATPRRRARISTRSTASCSIGCSAAARRSSRTPSSAAATCCAPAS